MHAWKIELAAAPPAAALLLISIPFIYYMCKGRKNSHTQQNLQDQNNLCVGNCLCFKDEPESLLRHSNHEASGWSRAYPIKPFHWHEHPALIAEAKDLGWSTFAFTYTCSKCPLQPKLWNICSGCCQSQQNQPELMWEFCERSVSIQKIRLNPGNGVGMVQSLQTAFPLPGPSFDPPAFPSEGYFEITILTEDREYEGDSSQNSFTENENVNLLSKQSSPAIRLSSDITLSFTSEALEKKLDLAADKDGKVKAKAVDHFTNSELIQAGDTDLQASHNSHSTERLGILAIGLAAGRTPPFRLPGWDPGSVGFDSDGRVYLNGALHIEEDLKACIAKRTWGSVNTTVGCGFDPTSNYIYFTLNGNRVSGLNAAANSEFGSPLFPTIAANYDVTLLVNFGQKQFKYFPANSERIADPCRRLLLSPSGKTGTVNEDSADLFSMGRIDAQWLSQSDSPTSQERLVLTEPESDLFEIVLDSQAIEFVNGK